jgi:hypothetical protein
LRGPRGPRGGPEADISATGPSRLFAVCPQLDPNLKE